MKGELKFSFFYDFKMFQHLAKKIFSLFIIACVFFLTGCIDIVEQINIEANGEGTYHAYVDMGFLGNVLYNLGSDKIDNKQLSEFNALPAMAADFLKTCEGISDVSTKNNLFKSGLSVKFKFKDAKALNAVFYKYAELKPHWYSPNLYKIKKHKFQRMNFAPFLRLYVKLYQKEIKEESFTTLVYYKSVLNLPSPAKKCTNQLYIGSSDKKTFTFRCTIDQLLNTNLNTGVKIKY